MIEMAGLTAQRRRLAGRIEEAVAAVLKHGQFILGPEVGELEATLAQRVGAGQAVTCASGTDALVLTLVAWGVGAGDAVFVPAFTFTATAEAVVRVGAVPVFVDVDDTFTMVVDRLAETVKWTAANGLRPTGVIPVDLFGQPADYGSIRSLAAREGLWVLADAAQSFGASSDGRPVGSLADATATSFFPAKPLGCYGDGGAVFTDDDVLADQLRSLRAHGLDGDKRESVVAGLNSRLDTLQAAILLAKLTVFDDELARRAELAATYDERLCGIVGTPCVRPGATSAWASYTVRTSDRDTLRCHLRTRGVASAVYYPVPLHRHPAYHACPVAPGGLPVADQLADEVLSLPVHPYLSSDDQAHVIEALSRGATKSA